MAGVAFAVAQNYMVDVVYLKNGSVIRGTIIEQVPNESIKIQTSDGSIFAYQIDEVQKMTKEAATQYFGAGRQWDNRFAAKRGYAGFVDIGGGFAIGDYAGPYAEITTSHGCQIIPYLFMGVGFGFHYDLEWDAAFVPVFADIRCNFLNSNITPFIGMKIGYSIGDGFYLNPSFGCRFGLSKNFAMNVTVNYQMQNALFESGSYRNYVKSRENMSNIGFKLGFEF